MVPVFDPQNRPLMPCSEKRARLLLDREQAFCFWKKGVFCIRLQREPSARSFQPLAIGLDPGSKREGYTVCTARGVCLNILTNTPYWVKGAVRQRRMLRRNRRRRKTPHRKPRRNRSCTALAPSTMARWQAKLRVLNWLSTLFPVTDVIVEDIKAVTWRGKNAWNSTFSPLQIGKKWFYQRVRKLWSLSLIRGFETKEWRDLAGYKKSTSKLSDAWEAHNVDSHCMCEWFFNSHIRPRKFRLRLNFLRLHRRQLHLMQPSQGGIRRRYGGTRSVGFKRGSWVLHPKYGLSYVGGAAERGISLHAMATGERLTGRAKKEDCRFLTYSTWRSTLLTT